MGQYSYSSRQSLISLVTQTGKSQIRKFVSDPDPHWFASNIIFNLHKHILDYEMACNSVSKLSRNGLKGRLSNPHNYWVHYYCLLLCLRISLSPFLIYINFILRPAPILRPFHCTSIVELYSLQVPARYSCSYSPCSSTEPIVLVVCRLKPSIGFTSCIPEAANFRRSLITYGKLYLVRFILQFGFYFSPWFQILH